MDMAAKFQDQTVFHMTGKRAGEGLAPLTAGFRPALLAPYRDLTRLRYDYPVVLVEGDALGGTCLNWGCIPTKALLKNAEMYTTLKHKADEFGLSFDNLNYDWSKVIGRSRQVSDKLAGGIEFLFKKNKIDYLRGTGALAGTSPSGGNKVSVTNAEGKTETHDAKNVLLATGFLFLLRPNSYSGP